MAVSTPPALTAQVGDRHPPATDSAATTALPVSAGQAFAGFEEFITAAMAKWQVPGLAIGVIRDGEIILARGFGYRDRDSRLPVTQHTIMAIGSSSKSFTVTLLAMLTDEGRLEWDRPVREYLPDFRLYDDFATAEMTPRDLVTHQSGLPRHDNMWYGRPRTRAELFRKLRYLEPNASFRSRYQYQNLMFMAAGHLAERITGTDWHRLIDERILTPLGMDRSNTSVRESPRSGDYALPYVLHEGVPPAGPASQPRSDGPGSIRQLERRRDADLHPGPPERWRVRGPQHHFRGECGPDAAAAFRDAWRSRVSGVGSGELRTRPCGLAVTVAARWWPTAATSSASSRPCRGCRGKGSVSSSSATGRET